MKIFPILTLFLGALVSPEYEFFDGGFDRDYANPGPEEIQKF